MSFSLGCIGLAIYLITTNDKGSLYGGIGILVVCVSAMLAMTVAERKRLFSKVSFSSKGIILSYFKRALLYFRWDEITNVKEKPKYRQMYIAFMRGQDSIEFEMTRAIYRTILQLCPESAVKSKLEGVAILQHYRA
jgi:hypothetical protein